MLLFFIFAAFGALMGGMAIGKCISETEPHANNRTKMLLSDVQFDIYTTAFLSIIFFGSHEYLITYMISKFVMILIYYDKDIESYVLKDLS